MIASSIPQPSIGVPSKKQARGDLAEAGSSNSTGVFRRRIDSVIPRADQIALVAADLKDLRASLADKARLVDGDGALPQRS